MRLPPGHPPVGTGEVATRHAALLRVLGPPAPDDDPPAIVWLRPRDGTALDPERSIHAKLEDQAPTIGVKWIMVEAPTSGSRGFGAGAAAVFQRPSGTVLSGSACPAFP